jgi:hypothetical protein
MNMISRPERLYMADGHFEKSADDSWVWYRRPRPRYWRRHSATHLARQTMQQAAIIAIMAGASVIDELTATSSTEELATLIGKNLAILCI